MTKIYTLRDPFTNEIRYVGKTVNTLKRRLAVHKSRRTKTYTNSWIKSLQNKGGQPIIELLEIVSNDVWVEEEMYYIAQFKSWGFDLTNLTEGGEGHIGHKQTLETIRKKSKSMMGHTLSQKTKDLISKANKGLVRSSEHISAQRKYWSERSGKAVEKYSLNNEFIEEYPSIMEAARSVNGDASTITRVCKNKPRYKTHKGYIWKFKI